MKPKDNLTGKQVVLITGATGAIGAAIVRGIAAHPDHEVVLAARDEIKMEKITRDIIRSTGNPAVRYEIVDLSRKAEIQALAARWQAPLHILINNAAASPRKRQETSEGIEVQFATNVLSYFWMTRAFEDILKQTAKKDTETAPSQPPPFSGDKERRLEPKMGEEKRGAGVRVINVASYWAGDLDLDDLEFKHRSYINGIAYRQSKQANIMLTTAFAWRLAPYGITVNVCHPGDVNSKLSNDLGFGGSETPEQGADTPVWLATAAEVANVTGKYIANRQLVRNRFLEMRDSAEKLYQICLIY